MDLIRLYEPTTKIFNNNGIKTLHPTKALVYKADNGDFYLELDDVIDNVRDYQQDYIITVPTPWGVQGFRIDNIKIQDTKISTKAYHLFYDAARYLIADSYVVDKNCNDALDHLNNATDTKSPFTVLSDVPSSNSFRCVRKTLEEAIATVLERWGGHLERDNYNIKIKQSIGQDRGVVLSYGKNITSIKAEENWDDVVTKILPVGKDGLTLPETYVTRVDNLYDIPYTKKISFDQDYIDIESFETEEAYKEALTIDLRVQANQYLMANYLPKVNYTLSAELENIADIGDVIYVNHPKCNVNITTNVISVTYDVLYKRYTKIEFGNFKKKLENLVTTTTKAAVDAATEEVKNTQVEFNSNLMEATSKINSVLNEGYVIKEQNQILVLDRLPKETAVHVIRINHQGIGFSSSGINGIFTSAWTIDGTLDMAQVNTINLTADLIKGGTLKLGSVEGEDGQIELYDESNTLIVRGDKHGLKVFGTNGTYVVLNPQDGFAGFDANNNKIYWADGDEFHMKKSIVEEEITIANKVRMLPITVYNNSNEITNDGIGFVAVV